MALLLQGDSPDTNITSEDVASQRLGGALVVGGATLAGGSALAGAGSAAQVGTTAATAACADGDCTNEVRTAAKILDSAKQVQPQIVRQTAYEVAKAGGRHAGFLREYASRSVGEIQKSIESLEARSIEHLTKLANPAKQAERWAQMDPREQQGLLQLWEKEATRYQEQADVLRGLLNELKGQ